MEWFLILPIKSQNIWVSKYLKKLKFHLQKMLKEAVMKVLPLLVEWIEMAIHSFKNT